VEELRAKIATVDRELHETRQSLELLQQRRAAVSAPPPSSSVFVPRANQNSGAFVDDFSSVVSRPNLTC
jgi:hypothetical protein